MSSSDRQTRVSRNATVSERLRIRSALDPETGCVNFTGAVCRNGYGLISVGKKVRKLVHRAAYEAANGPIPGGLVVDHLCRNRRCVNPAHLETVTNRENVLRGVSPGALTATTGVCRNGHPMDAANTADYGRGRICLACRKATRKASANV